MHAVDDDAVIGESIYCTLKVFGICCDTGRFDSRVAAAGECAAAYAADAWAGSAGGSDRAAVDGNIAGPQIPAADACTVALRSGSDRTAVDGNIAGTRIPAADSCAVACRSSSDRTAVDGNGAAAAAVTTADAGAARVIIDNQFVTGISLTVNGQRIALVYFDSAVNSQFVAT